MMNDITRTFDTMAKRAVFSGERDIFVKLIRENKNSFGDMRDSINVKNMKKKTWKIISDALNANCSAKRSELQLKDYLKRLKMTARAKLRHTKEIFSNVAVENHQNSLLNGLAKSRKLFQL